MNLDELANRCGLSADHCRVLQRSGALGGLGDTLPPNPNGEPGPFEVTADEAAFLDLAKKKVAWMRDQAEHVIGPPGWFDWGARYGEQWGRLYDVIAGLQEDAKKHLEIGSPQMAAFNKGLAKLESAIFKIRNESATSQLYDAVIAAFTGNPIALMNYVVRQVKSAGGLVTETAAAAKSMYWPPTKLWDFLPRWAKVLVGVTAVTVPVIAVRKVKRIVS